MYEELKQELVKFLADYKGDVSDIKYNDEAGYPKEDAAFDRVFLEDFPEYLEDIDKSEIWDDFNDAMDEDIESEDYAEAAEVWNSLCDLVKAKVKKLLA